MEFVLEDFQGPLDLLFHLIEKNQIDVYNIPIAELTDQYITHISLMPKKDMDSMSEFVFMASALLEIKSRMLLPQKQEDEEEEDLEQSLINRLIEYKQIKELAAMLQAKEGFSDTIYFKQAEKGLIEALAVRPVPSVDEVLQGLTVETLMEAFKETMRRRELKTDKIHSSFTSVSKELYTIESKIKQIQNLLAMFPAITFHGIFGSPCSRQEIITTFLALLELIRMRQIVITQEKTFDEIWVRAQNSNAKQG